MRGFLCVLRVLCGEKGFVFMGCRHESSGVERSRVASCRFISLGLYIVLYETDAYSFIT